MKIFLVGASGFIGERILKALLLEGHDVTGCVRRPDDWQKRYPAVKWISGDYARDQRKADWVTRISGCDAIINAVGIIREAKGQTFEDLHSRGPCALFDAAVSCGIRMVMQISALGADEGAETAYHLTKRAADSHLSGLGLDHVILLPSLVMGVGAESTRLFSALSFLPILGLPGGGGQMLQPVSVEDLVSAIVRLLRNWPKGGHRFDVVGGHSISLVDLIRRMRPIGLRAMEFPIPMPVIRAVASLRLGLLDPGALQMLERGNCGDPRAIEATTGLRMRSVDEFWIAGDDRSEGRGLILSFLLPFMRIGIAFLWVWTGIVSAFLFPPNASYEWLMAAGVPGSLLNVALYGASALDMLLGVMLVTRLRRPTYLVQFLLVSFYTIVVSFSLPGFWLHPFGPISKNVPLLVATLFGFLLDAPEHERRR